MKWKWKRCPETQYHGDPRSKKRRAGAAAAAVVLVEDIVDGERILSGENGARAYDKDWDGIENGDKEMIQRWRESHYRDKLIRK